MQNFALLNYVKSKFGNCSKCLRQAFACAFLAWCGAGVAALVVGLGIITDTTLMLSLLLTFLWLAHFTRFSALTYSATRQRNSVRNISLDRRSALVLGLRSVTLTFLISAAPRNALAAGYGGCGQDGCPTCSRPSWNDNDQLNGCIYCHSCPNDNGIFNCGGQTC
jgi:hypothetical protein